MTPRAPIAQWRAISNYLPVKSDTANLAALSINIPRARSFLVGRIKSRGCDGAGSGESNDATACMRD